MNQTDDGHILQFRTVDEALAYFERQEPNEPRNVIKARVIRLVDDGDIQIGLFRR